jgi:flagellar biogenesis protein FliO
MSEFLGIENSALKFVIAFVLVMALIGLTAWLIRQFGAVRPGSSSGTRSRLPRLAVLDSAAVDARRRLVLIRRDNVEHLLMIGGPTDVVVEANVVRAQAPTAQAPAMQRAAPPRAPIEPIEPIEADYDPSLVPIDEPYYEEPAAPQPPVRPAAPPRPAPVVRAPAPAPRAAAPVPQRPAPAVTPARPQPQFPDMAQRLEAALRAPAPESAAPRPLVEPRVTTPHTAPPVRMEPQISTSAASAADSASKDSGDVFANLEEEMANLLKPSGKPSA